MKVSELVDALLEMPQSMNVQMSVDGDEVDIQAVFKDRASVIISDIGQEN
jgi:hypothetical protein